MSNPTETIETFQAMSLFAEFTETELRAFLDLTEPISAKKGECIVKQDDHGDCMFVLTSGRARVVHRRDGKEFLLAELKTGDFFGEIALVDEGPRSADVEALEDCTLMRIPHAMLRALAGVYPSAAFKLLIGVGRVLVARMRGGNKKYIDSLLAAAPGNN